MCLGYSQGLAGKPVWMEWAKRSDRRQSQKDKGGVGGRSLWRAFPVAHKEDLGLYPKLVGKHIWRYWPNEWHHLRLDYKVEKLEGVHKSESKTEEYQKW